jgi:hypothetical protein
MAKAIAIRVKLVSSADTDFYYVTKKTDREAGQEEIRSGREEARRVPRRQEGNELPVLKGLRHVVSLISFECNLPEFLNETTECLSLLANRSTRAVFNYCTMNHLPASNHRNG